MVSKRIFVSTVVTLSLVQFVTCNAIGLDETGTHSSQLQSEDKFDVNHINEDSSEFKPATKDRSSEEKFDVNHINEDSSEFKPATKDRSSEDKFDVNHINENSSEFKTATKERSSEENVSENTEVPKVHGHSTGQSTIHLEVPKVHGHSTGQSTMTMVEVPKVHGHSTGQSTIHLEVHDTDEDALSTTSEDMAYSLMEQPADSHVESTPATL